MVVTRTSSDTTLIEVDEKSTIVDIGVVAVAFALTLIDACPEPGGNMAVVRYTVTTAGISPFEVVPGAPPGPVTSVYSVIEEVDRQIVW